MTAGQLLAQVRERAKPHGALPTADADVYNAISLALRSYSWWSYALRDEAATFTAVTGKRTYGPDDFDDSRKPVFVNDVTMDGAGFWNYRRKRGMVTNDQIDAEERLTLSQPVAGDPYRIVRQGKNRFELFPPPSAAAAGRAWKADIFYLHPPVTAAGDEILFDAHLDEHVILVSLAFALEVLAQGDTLAVVQGLKARIEAEAEAIKSQQLTGASAYSGGRAPRRAPAFSWGRR